MKYINILVLGYVMLILLTFQLVIGLRDLITQKTCGVIVKFQFYEPPSAPWRMKGNLL